MRDFCSELCVLWLGMWVSDMYAVQKVTKYMTMPVLVT